MGERKFSVSSESWYGRALGLEAGVVEEIVVSVACPTRRVPDRVAEVTFRWEDYGSSGVLLEVRVFDNAFTAFTEAPGLFQGLVGLEDMSPEGVRRFLLGMGFEDATRRLDPDRDAEPMSPEQLLRRVYAYTSKYADDSVVGQFNAEIRRTLALEGGARTAEDCVALGIHPGLARGEK